MRKFLRHLWSLRPTRAFLALFAIESTASPKHGCRSYILFSTPPCVPHSPPDHIVRKKSTPTRAIPPRHCAPHARLRALSAPKQRGSHRTHDAAPEFRFPHPNETT